VRDPQLEAYVVAIERHLSSLKGSEHVLSPPDFALARAWHAAAVPLAAVLAGIDRALEDDAGVSSLKRCRRFVERLAASAPAAAAGASATPPSDELSGLLEALRGALAGAAPAAAFELPARRLAELLDLTAVAREPNWDYLRRKLTELDELVDQAALEALPPGELLTLTAEAKLALPAQKTRGRAPALEQARLRYLRRRARARFALPRVAGG
jgi:hypothetical protein